jgi:hypothetical protein
LRDVVGGMRVADPPADESAQTLVEIRPKHVRGCSGGGHRHSQRFESAFAPQQSAFSGGSQQVAWTSGAQQETLVWLGGGAGALSVCSFIDLFSFNCRRCGSCGP